MVRLTDDELRIVMAAARPLRPDQRQLFLNELASVLGHYSGLGPGVLHRLCRDLQRRFFDPPDLSGSAAE